MIEVRFEIDNDTYIRVTCNEVDQLNQIIMFSPGKIELWYQNKPLYLLHTNSYSCISSLWDATLRAQDSLEAVLKDELEPLSAWPSVGYILNESYHYVSLPQDDPNDKVTQYVMWSPGLLPSTLLYNRNGEIILQVIPIFRWFINKIPYKVFIRNYRPYLTRIISHETAQKWLDQVVKLRKIMLDNYERDKANMVEEVWSPKKSTSP